MAAFNASRPVCSADVVDGLDNLARLLGRAAGDTVDGLAQIPHRGVRVLRIATRILSAGRDCLDDLHNVLYRFARYAAGAV
jgi:hypothetical protein